MGTTPSSKTQTSSSGKKFAVTATVLGVCGILFSIIPYVGILLGILALVFVLIAKAKKTKAMPGLILSILSIGVGIFATILVTWLSTGSLPFDTTRLSIYNAQINEKKSFTIRETAKIGPVDVKITSVERDASGSTPIYERIIIKADATLNGDRDIGNGTNVINDVELNGSTLDEGDVIYPDEKKSLSSTKPTKIEYEYVISRRLTTSPLTLTYKMYVYKDSSPIVGTEGSRRTNLDYSIILE